MDVSRNHFRVFLEHALILRSHMTAFDALIEFPAEGVEVIWDGSHIANIALPPICSAGGSGVPSLDIIGQLTITDQTRFTDFATAILLTPSFTWNIATNNLRVYALDTIFDNVTLTKNVSFSGTLLLSLFKSRLSKLTYFIPISVQWITRCFDYQPRLPWRCTEWY